MNYNWFTKEFCDKVAPVLTRTPLIGRVVLEQEAGISKWQAEKFLAEYRRLGLMHDAANYHNAAMLSDKIYNTISNVSPVVKEKEPEEPNTDKKGYKYSLNTDMYGTTMVINGQTFNQWINGEEHRAMLKDYSDWNGDKHSMDAFLAKYGIEKQWFEQYKKIHGWTRDSVPVTKEQLQTETEEVLSDALLSTKRENVLRKMEEKAANTDKEDAEKWRNLENSLLKPLEALAEKHRPLNAPTTFSFKPSTKNFELILGAVDLHYGKYGWAGEVQAEYSRAIAAERLKEKTHELLRRVLKQGMPEKVIIPAANDWLHIDNHQGTTTRGTPQDLDGTPAQILSEGFDLFTHYVTMVKQVVPNVEVLFIPDNHAKLLGLALMKYTQAYFRLDEDVNVDVAPFPRKYRMVGKTLCAFEHELRKETPSQMAGEAAAMWGKSKYRVAFGAHLHHESLYASDKNGVLLYQLPTISGDDRWHTDQGYTLSRKALGGYLIDYEEGVVNTMFAPV